MTPFNYVKKYHSMWTLDFVPSGPANYILYGWVPVLTPVYQYLNARYKNKAGKSPSERMDFKNHLLGFFKARAKQADSGIVYTKGEGYDLLCSLYPVHDFPKSNFMACMCCKGSPEMLFDFIQFIGYWRAYQYHILGKTDVAPVWDIVDKYLGVDCNGFVGHYLNTVYAGVKAGPSTPEKYFRTGGKFRQSPMDFHPEDVLVFGDFGHVAIIDSVASRASNLAKVFVCESRGKDAGGPQGNWFDIEHQHDKKGSPVPGKFKIRGKDLDSVVRVKGT